MQEAMESPRMLGVLINRVGGVGIAVRIFFSSLLNDTIEIEKAKSKNSFMNKAMNLSSNCLHLGRSLGRQAQKL